MTEINEAALPARIAIEWDDDYSEIHGQLGPWAYRLHDEGNRGYGFSEIAEGPLELVEEIVRRYNDGGYKRLLSENHGRLTERRRIVQIIDAAPEGVRKADLIAAISKDGAR